MSPQTRLISISTTMCLAPLLLHTTPINHNTARNNIGNELNERQTVLKKKRIVASNKEEPAK
mgnify:CR=1 FL=1